MKRIFQLTTLNIHFSILHLKQDFVILLKNRLKSGFSKDNTKKALFSQLSVITFHLRLAKKFWFLTINFRGRGVILNTILPLLKRSKSKLIYLFCEIK